MCLPFQAAVFRKGKPFGRPGKLAWTAKASHFEERLPPLRGKMSPQVTKGGVWQRVSADGEGEDANVFAIYRL